MPESRPPSLRRSGTGSEVAATKKRPALLLSRTARAPRYGLVTLAMITSQVEALDLQGDVMLEDWEEAGLIHPSLLRLAKVATVDEELIDKQIGRLSRTDRAHAVTAFRRVFADWLR